MDPIGRDHPGSGPAHFALFGYDPFEYNIGRGILEATGIDFPLTEQDVVARMNFATVDSEGRSWTGGRPDSHRNQPADLQEIISGTAGGERVKVIVEPVKEHRAILVLRGEGLRGKSKTRIRAGRGPAPGAESRRTGGGKNGLPGGRNCDPDRKDLRGNRKPNMVLLRVLPNTPGTRP